MFACTRVHWKVHMLTRNRILRTPAVDPYFLTLLHACSSRCVPAPISTWNLRIFLCLPRGCQSELAPWQHPLLAVRLAKPFRTYLQLTFLCIIVTQVGQVILPCCQGDTVNELIAKDRDAVTQGLTVRGHDPRRLTRTTCGPCVSRPPEG